jgi:hypothetical protein
MVLAGGAVGGLVWLILGAQLKEARAELAIERHGRIQAEATLDRQAQAAAVHRAHLDRMSEMDRGRIETIDFLRELEGGDAPLSDYLRASGERLWGQ